MVINVSVQYNGGFLPDVLLLTLCDYTGEPISYHEELLSLQPMFSPESFDIPPEGKYSGGLDEFIFLFKHHPEGKSTR